MRGCFVALCVLPLPAFFEARSLQARPLVTGVIQIGAREASKYVFVDATYVYSTYPLSAVLHSIR